MGMTSGVALRSASVGLALSGLGALCVGPRRAWAAAATRDAVGIESRALKRLGGDDVQLPPVAHDEFRSAPCNQQAWGWHSGTLGVGCPLIERGHVGLGVFADMDYSDPRRR